MTKRAKIKAFMWCDLESATDKLTGEISPTCLAEDAALVFEHDEWLDDDQGFIWDLAFEVAYAAKYDSENNQAEATSD